MTPEYRKAYERGWRAAQRSTGTALEAADLRRELDAWYDGYHDYAAGRDKWHLAHCTDHDNC